jgi:hypothetical protein
VNAPLDTPARELAAFLHRSSSHALTKLYGRDQTTPEDKEKERRTLPVAGTRNCRFESTNTPQKALPGVVLYYATV